MASDDDVPHDPNGLEDPAEAPTLNTVEELRTGIIRTTQGQRNFTILLVGETGTGKTTLLSLIANILHGHSPMNYKTYNEEANEAGGSSKHSQTNDAKLYEFVSRNDITIRILDTPGLADTRGIAQDEMHKKSTIRVIQEKVTTVNAVIILANGTLPRLSVATDYALSTLCGIFPATLSNNIGFIFTNISDSLNSNFDPYSIPDTLRQSRQFFLDNPVALDKKRLLEEQNIRSMGTPIRSQITFLNGRKRQVENKHQDALAEFVEIFDWVDSLSPQPTEDILSLYEQTQQIEKNISDALATMNQIASKKATLVKIKKETDGTKLTIEQYKQYESTITQKVYKQTQTKAHNTLCSQPQCYSNCHKECTLAFSLDPDHLHKCKAFGKAEKCTQCKHSYKYHRHYNAKWELKDDKQVTVDRAAKAKYHNAVDEKEKQMLGMKELKANIDNMDKALAEATRQVGKLAEEYASLSLSGSFAGQVKKSVALLDQNLEAMRNNGTDADTIESMVKSLGRMKDKLELVERAAKQAQENTCHTRN
ncbi:hypothetical protein PAXINDRAFT_171543 [Paxillus involutus ATCC 200175]|uniref:AIG1-type G domain-containing protein n=1 Tax=Paxillus involutus ATCC 200175 TaxID=664439 RepID=A0A0C9T8D9_PAXIN|nr:hypothetical protein PAXINDRAFT_171543 [Paxillus involutus ATCC 200175]